jgi:putative spermidine/putrescine transport system permease protein
METRGFKILIKVFAALLLVFLYVPLAIIVLYAFNDSVAQAWPIEEFTTKWFGIAWRSPQVREALANSLEVATIATLFALALGSAAGVRRPPVPVLRTQRRVVPAGPADRAAGDRDRDRAQHHDQQLPDPVRRADDRDRPRDLLHRGGLQQRDRRLRRTPTSLDRGVDGPGADGWQTFRYVTFPAIRTALVAGALLAFALSFDEIVVTNFTAGATDTIPRFIYRNLRLPHNRPIVNVVALGVILVMFIPVYVAQRMAGGGDVTATAAKAEAAEV